jgi:lysyl-tRNA synthetase class 1
MEEKMAHWAFEIADKIIAKNPNKEEYICAAGISPSGSVHIGNFRDIATSYFVVRALRAKGKKAKLLFSWDDFDRLRKVPVNVQNITSGFEVNIGKPYTMIDNPYADGEKSYGRHFEVEFENSLKELGVVPDIIRYQTENYTSGKYTPKIKLALERRKEIYDIMMSFKTQDANDEDRENYYPISVYCEHTLHDNTKVTSYNEKTGELKFYCDDCKTTHTVNVNNYNLIKLVWKVDWPMRWQAEGVDFEPGGIDHASANGSFDVATVIEKQIFGIDAPIFQGYGWLGIRGLCDSMHSSSGMNITPSKVLEIFEPEIVRWLFAKYHPEDSFDFAFDDFTIRLYSEYDKLLKNYKEGNVTEIEKQTLEMVWDDPMKEQEKTAFGVLSSVSPIVNYKPDLLKKSLAKAGFEFNDNSLARLSKAKNWIENYNADKNYKLLSDFNETYYGTMSDAEKQVLSSIAEYSRANDFTEKDIQQYIYSVINDPNATKKENVERQKLNFKNLYNMLFGRDDGPRLYLYLAAVDKEKYLHLLAK